MFHSAVALKNLNDIKAFKKFIELKLHYMLFFGSRTRGLFTKYLRTFFQCCARSEVKRVLQKLYVSFNFGLSNCLNNIMTLRSLVVIIKYRIYIAVCLLYCLSKVKTENIQF